MHKNNLRTSLLPFVFVFILVFSCAIPCFTVSAEENMEFYEGNQGEYFKLNNSEMTACLDTVPSDKSIQKLVIPEVITKNGKKYTVTAIENNSYFSKIKNINIPKTVNRIGVQIADYPQENFFASWEALESITVDPNNNSFCSLDGVLYDKNKNELMSYPVCKKNKEFIIPQSVAKIRSMAFINNAYLESVTMPSEMKVINSYAFNGCKNLRTINMTEQYIELIGSMAFRGTQWEANQPVNKDIYIGTIAYQCREINGNSEYSFKEGTTAVCDGFISFANEAQVNKIKKIILPKSLKSISTNTFLFFNELETISVDNDNEFFCSDENGILFTKDKKMLICYPRGRQENFYTVPEGVEIIGNTAFSSSKITEINLPKSLKLINPVAFVQSKLKSIRIPGNVSEIGQSAFGGCQSLENIKICEGVQTIADGAFAGCTNIKNIIIPSTVESIGSYTFYGISTLMSKKGTYTEEFCKSNGLIFVDYIEKINKDIKEINNSEGKSVYATYSLNTIYNMLDEDEKKLIVDGDKIASMYERSLFIDKHPPYRNSYFDKQLYIIAKTGILPENIDPTVSEKNITEEQEQAISEKLHRIITPISGFELNLVTKKGEQAAASTEFGTTEATYKFLKNTSESQYGERALIYLDTAGNITEVAFTLDEDGKAVFEVKGSGTYAFVIKGEEIKDSSSNIVYIIIGVAAFVLPTAIYIIVKEKKERAKKIQET